jgi:hypothetical protein
LNARWLQVQRGGVVTQSWRSIGEELFPALTEDEIWRRESGENRRRFAKIKMWLAFANKSFDAALSTQQIVAPNEMLIFRDKTRPWLFWCARRTYFQERGPRMKTRFIRPS